ncbi:MAG TPA: hypothetical protein VF006_30650 [Longimicrobium sp.]
MWFSSKIVNVLTALAGTTLSESAKLVALSITGSPGVADASGALTLDLVTSLTQQTSSVEKKIDRLLREPLATGLRLLSEALRHPPRNEQEYGARDALLDNAHVSFVQALPYGGDSYEDATLIRGLDCIALKYRRGLSALAASTYLEFTATLDSVRTRVTRLEEDSAAFTRSAQALGEFFVGDRNRAKPFGYAEQKALYLSRKREAEALARRAAQDRKKLDILEVVALLASPAKEVVAHPS